MASVIGVRFRNAGKLYYFDPGPFWPTAGDAVIVETVRGVEYGEVVTGVREVSDELITPPLKPVLRIATPEDAQHQQDNEAREADALDACQKKVDEHKLPMKLVGCEYTFDNGKILFYFTSDKRVDFRGLVKDLAAIFHTRIELRQIGVRDEAKMMGGLGLCGRPVCCATFLGDFQPVSIKMAKEQSLSLNPTKISGVCGRLMCCLKYEEDHYEATRKRMPRIGKEVITPDGNGIVVDLNILKETVRVRIPKGDGAEQKDYPLEEVQRVMPAQRTIRERMPAETQDDMEDLPEEETAVLSDEEDGDIVDDASDEMTEAETELTQRTIRERMPAETQDDMEDLPEEETAVLSDEEDEDVVDDASDEMTEAETELTDGETEEAAPMEDAQEPGETEGQPEE